MYARKTDGNRKSLVKFKEIIFVFFHNSKWIVMHETQSNEINNRREINVVMYIYISCYIPCFIDETVLIMEQKIDMKFPNCHDFSSGLTDFQYPMTCPAGCTKMAITIKPLM